MKPISALVVTALLIFAAGVAHADDITGGDSRVVIVPGDPPPASSCSSVQFATASDGTISADCAVTGSPITSITFAVPAADVLGGGLSCDSVLSDDLNWTATSGSIVVGGVSADTCTFTAPSKPTTLLGLAAYLLTPGGASAYAYAALNDPGVPINLFNPLGNDGDCDADDFMFDIPVGCDIGFNTPAGATIDNTEAFAPDALVDVSGNGVSGLIAFPEPGTWAMLLIGLVPLAFLRRRVARR